MCHLFTVHRVAVPRGQYQIDIRCTTSIQGQPQETIFPVFSSARYLSGHRSQSKLNDLLTKSTSARAKSGVSSALRQ